MADTIENLVKFGYLTEQDIQTAIDDGILTPYAIAFSKDTHRQFLVGENKEMIEIKSRVECYNSVTQALDYLNASSTTYEGQIVSILSGDRFRGYIVNKSDAGFYVTDLAIDPGAIDYDSLENIPLKNIRGEYVNPVILKDLEDGTYKVTGFFVTPDGVTLNSIIGNIVIVESETDTLIQSRNIKRIDSDQITDYVLIFDDVTVKSYVTDDWLVKNEYTTKTEVSSMISALNYVTEQQMKSYVQNLFDTELIKIIDERIEDTFEEYDQSDIENIFKKTN